MSPRAVVVAHGEVMVAEGIAAALARFPSIVPIGIATTAADGERRGERADAVVLDQGLPGADAAAGRLRRKGVRVTTREPVASLAAALAPNVPFTPRTVELTARERQVMALVAHGMPAKQVARHLGISPRTVEHHQERVRRKLGAPNQAAAVRMVTESIGEMEAWVPTSI
jgi:DNA-binding NarL/FixJ family response regulator